MPPPPFAHAVQAGMFVREVGPTASPALLWVHGLGESGLCFEAIARHPALGAWRHLVPDLPGYGRSAWPPEPLPLDAQADALAAWLEARGEAAVVVVGHSLGGVIGGLVVAMYLPIFTMAAAIE